MVRLRAPKQVKRNMSNLGNLGFSNTGGASESVPQDFAERVKQAVERMRAEGIELWCPSIDGELEKFFDVVISGPSEGCTNEQCNHNSHDPASPYIKLIPRQGKLVFLGEVEYGETRYYYYALLTSSAKYFEKREERFYHDGIHEVSGDEVPDFLLARLGE